MKKYINYELKHTQTMESLLNLCVQHISNRNIKHLNEKLNQVCYDKIVDYQMVKGFDRWKEQMKMLKIELNIKDIDVHYDMFFDEPYYFIYIKFRHSEEEDDYDYDYEIYRNDYDSPLYHIYYDIAKRRGLID